MSEAMNYKLPPLPDTPETFQIRIKHGEDPVRQDLFTAEQMQAYAIAAIEAQGVPDGYAGAAAFTNVMPTVAIHFSATEQALSFIDKIRASWDRQQRSIASAHPAPQAAVVPQEPVAYLDIGAVGYIDLGTDLSTEQLQALPAGRHMLGIVGTFGADGYVPAPQSKPQPLSDEQIELLMRSIGTTYADDNDERMRNHAEWQRMNHRQIVRATEAAHGIKE